MQRVPPWVTTATSRTENAMTTDEARDAIPAAILAGKGRTAAQLGRQANVNPTTVFRWMVSGVSLPEGGKLILPHVRLGKRLYSTEAALLAFIAANLPPTASERAPR